MSIELEPTGERVIEDAYFRSLGAYVIYVMHAASYGFAESFCEGKAVLDLGCGSGYGAARISKVATSVCGVDISQEAIDFARARYAAPNLSYARIEPGSPLPFDDATFDVALSFQVIEHVPDDVGYLREAQRVLKPGGVMIVITPDRRHRLLPAQKPWNRWHLREYSASGLAQLISQVFDLQQSLRMGAPWSIAGVEHRRYRITKWLTLPVTLPFIPERLRRHGLDFIHSLRSKPAAVDAQSTGPLPKYDFDEQAILIAPDPPHSLNLVMVARKAGGSQQ
ncbi:MAG: class I SAM-dependent methyltransferase [Pseudoxanthomonas sp.]